MAHSRSIARRALRAAGIALLAGVLPPPAGAQERPAAEARPRPYPVAESPAFRRAVERGTRTRTGRPGPRYWTQYAHYALSARLDPATRRLTGTGTVRYRNRSPDTLATVAVYLHPNLFAPGAPRTDPVPATGGMELTRVAAQGRALREVGALDEAGTPAYAVSGTVATLRLPRPIAPGDSADFEFAWSYVVPPDGAPRTGTDGETWFIAYWYPQIAVYDDVDGWFTDPYLGRAEFYMGYADYDVSVTVPQGWLVGATGTLRNAAEVLTPQTLARLDSARRGAGVVHVVAAADRGAGRATRTSPDRRLTWRFQASGVRDFAWGTSDRYLWDAAAAVAGDATGDGRPDTVAVHAFYRPEKVAWAWDRSAVYTRHSVEFLSRYLWPYPYPQMTSMDGVVSCSGMEYPMMSCIGGQRDTISLYSVTAHETAHMWFPMSVGSNERRFTWQDEGLTRFNQAQAVREFFHGPDPERNVRARYLELARMGGRETHEGEAELMRHGDLFPTQLAFSFGSYDKTATALRSLRALLGEEVFVRALREYGRRWTGRHPQPYDLWNTFEDVAGRDLDWFWRTWWYETWTLDQAVAGVRVAGADTEITVADLGMAPMPARLVVTRADGSTERVEVPVEVWLGGARSQVVRVRSVPAVARVEIDPEEGFPDIDRTNNVWRSRN